MLPCWSMSLGWCSSGPDPELPLCWRGSPQAGTLGRPRTRSIGVWGRVSLPAFRQFLLFLLFSSSRPVVPSLAHIVTQLENGNIWSASRWLAGAEGLSVPQVIPTPEWQTPPG